MPPFVVIIKEHKKNDSCAGAFTLVRQWQCGKQKRKEEVAQKEVEMADKKLVEAITSMNEDFAQWYTDVVKKAELIDYSNVKGCMVIKPAGYAIWENIQRQLDERFKATGVENVYMPMFIPESLLQKEKDHVEGFAPEVAWVTHGGLNPLQERMCVRPTSETLFCDFYKGDIQSYRDLPKVYNQWCSVVRWEKETRPFLRSREFLWQEGHTAHATAEQAEERTEQMLNVYADFCEEVLAIPVVKGRKTDKEKFAGAEATYTIEALMHDGKALQSGTSHNFGDGQSIAKLGLTIRGIYGEGSEALGDLYQVSNQVTLGRTEDEIIEAVSAVGKKLIDMESALRERSLKEAHSELKDALWRSYGLMCYARQMDEKEFMLHWSHLRLGVCSGLFQTPLAAVDELLTVAQSAHAKRYADEMDPSLSPEQARCEIIRKTLQSTP